jgi:hypothetical protein
MERNKDFAFKFAAGPWSDPSGVIDAFEAAFGGFSL